MTMRAETSVSATDVVIPLPMRPRRLAEGFLAPVADGAAALFFDEPGPEVTVPEARRRLAVEADGAALTGPLVSTAVALRTGGTRHVVLLGRGADWLLARRLVVARAGVPAAVLDPEWLQSPLVDVAALFEGLTDEGRQRLLRLLVTTGASLLGRGARAGFARSARRLLALLGVQSVEPLAWCRLGASARVVSYRLPANLDPARFEAGLGTLVTLAGDSLGRLSGDPLAVERRGGDALVHVFLAAAPAGATLVATGATALAFGLPEADAPALPIERWLPERDAATRTRAEALLVEAAAGDATAAAILRELRHRADPAPALAIAHLSGTPAGVLHALALDDPHGLVREVRVTRGTASATLPVEGGTVAPGYLALPRMSAIEDHVRLALVTHSGRSLAVSDGRLPPFDGTDPATIATEAVAAARIDRERGGRVLRTETFGTAETAPTLALVCPAGANLDIVSTRAALVAGEPDGAASELVYHVAEGPAAAAARSALDRAAAASGLAHRLVVVTPDLDPADRLAAAIAVATAPAVLVLGADVLPAEPGWRAPWRRLSRRHPMLRAAVRGYDGSRTDTGSDCLGLFRDPVDPLLAEAVRYGAPDVLVAQIAAALAARGTPEARLGLVFTRFGDGSLTSREKSVDAAALALILKRSFSIACDHRRP